jgi:2-desacetyl-2-hydroxyethyl bacteriochlorophyllide A dehydrogenase
MTSYRATVVQAGVIEMQVFEPSAPKAGEVLLRTRASLISPGTERAFFLALPNTNAAYPLYPGYSNISEVVDVGPGVTGIKAGDRVACGVQHASHITADAAKCVLVPSGLPDEDATFFNLIAIAMQGVRKTHIELGEPVIVIGVGPIGLFALQLARLNGALPAIAVDRDEKRLALARQMGADVTLMSDDNLLDAVQAHTNGTGAPVVIEATGASLAILLAFQLAAVRGRVCLVGTARGETDGINFYRDVHRKGLQIIGAHEITRPRYETFPGWWTQRDEQRAALRMLALGRFSVQPLISHRFHWDQFPQAYDLLANWDPNVIGMVINWQ